MHRLIRSPRSDERGFTMVTVILAMMVLSMLAVGAYAASVGDMPVARKDQDRKRAYEAAQAGADWYLNMLRADPTYWERCAPATPTAAVPLTLEGQPSQGAWKTVDGDQDHPAPTDSRFRVEIMNARRATGPSGGTICDSGAPSQTALDDKGLFWIRSTGVAGGKVRSILVGMLQNSDFLRYVYFSNWESQEPQFANATRNWDPLPAPNGTIGGSTNQCDYNKKTRDLGPVNQYSQLVCLSAQYLNGDKILGSIHTNDDAIMGCGAQLGNSSSDKLEVSGATATTWNARSDVTSYPDAPFGKLALGYACPSGSGNPNPVASVVAPAPMLQLPPSNSKLLRQAESTPGNLVLQGQTCLKFIGSGQIQVFDSPTAGSPPATGSSRHKAWGQNAGTAADPRGINCEGAGVTPRTVAIPSGGIIYVKNADNAGCTPRLGHNMATSYTSSPGCGDVSVEGTYGKSVTVAAENDIIVRKDLTRDGDTMLGLIANGYIRLYNPLTGDPYRFENQEGQVLDPAFKNYNDGCGWICGVYPNPEYLPCGPTFLFNNWFSGRQQKVPGFTPVKNLQAAILSMQHTFVLDNMNCPFQFSAAQTLQFEGSISVYYGTQIGGCVILGCAGYMNRIWKWDARFKSGQPPHFIAPLNSDGRWTVSRRSEQVPTPVGAT